MKRKSLITVIVCLIICGILVGCGQSTAADISDKAVEETKVEEKAPKKIIPLNLSHIFSRQRAYSVRSLSALVCIKIFVNIL